MLENVSTLDSRKRIGHFPWEIYILIERGGRFSVNQSEDRYAMCKVLISDNGIDRAYCPVLEEEEGERRKERLVKACISLMDAEERCPCE